MAMHLQVIVFSFSKKECEALALQMATLDLNSDDEKTLVAGVFNNAIDCLSEEDRRQAQPLQSSMFLIHFTSSLPAWSCHRIHIKFTPLQLVLRVHVQGCEAGLLSLAYHD